MVQIRLLLPRSDTIMVMLVMEFFTWWYTRGWKLVVQDLRRRLSLTLQLFSVPSLLRTLFSPWRRIVTYPGASLDARMRAMGDNLVSRGVGFVVRFFTLIAAGVTLVVVATLSITLILVWPLLPLGIVVAFIMGVLG